MKSRQLNFPFFNKHFYLRRVRMVKSNPYDIQIIKNLKRKIKDLHYINQKNSKKNNDFYTDPLTELLTKEAFFHSVRKILDTNPNDKFLFFRFDIDKFQMVNILFGDQEGDRLLKYCASALQEMVNPYSESILGRIDADIFCSCCKLNVKQDIQSVLYEDIDSFLKNYREDYRFNISMGLYYIQDNKESIQNIYSRATIASRKCKDSSNLYLYCYDDTMNKEILKNQLIVSEMYNALKNGEFVPFLQPKVDLQTGKLVGAEALVRWKHPKRGLVAPQEFIPLFEQNGFIVKLDQNIFRQVCQFIKDWISMGIEPVPISLNLSQFNFTNSNLVTELISILDEYKVDKKYIHFEITETAYSVDTKQTLQIAKELDSHGLHLEMDDFGTGISSLTMLNELPVKTLKLDLRFIQSYSEAHNNGNILNFIVSLAKQMQITLIAEGIETEDQLRFLKSIGCDYGQGYLFSKPIEKKEYDKILTSWTILHANHVEADMNSILDMNDLWFPNSKFNFLFNILVGGVAIYEIDNEVTSIKLIRANDDYFTVLGLAKQKEQLKTIDVSTYILEDDFVVLKNKIIDSIAHNSPLAAEIRIANFSNSKQHRWIKIGSRIIVRNKENTLFLVNLENITTEKERTTHSKREMKIHTEYKKQLSIYQDVHSSGVATIRIDDRISLIYANDAFLQLHECSRKYAFTHFNSIIAAMIYPKDFSMSEKALKSLLREKKEHVEWTMQIITKKGNIRAIVVSAFIRYENDGTYADIVARDITNTKSLKTQIEDTENKIKHMVLDSSPTIFDIKTKVCYWSTDMQKAFNLPPITENFLDSIVKNIYIRVDSIKVLKNTVKQLLYKEESTIIADLWLKKANLTQYECEKITFASEENKYGEVVRIYAVSFDVLKRASENKYFELYKILSNIPGCVIVISSTTTELHYANDAYFNLIGYSKEEIGTLFYNAPSIIIHSDDLQEYEVQVYGSFVKNNELHMKGRYKHKSGKELWLRIDGKQIGEEIFCTVSDETESTHTCVELEAEKQFNKTITSFANDIFFHFDLLNKTIRFSGTLAHEYMPRIVYENFPQFIQENNIGVQEDFHNLVDLIDAMSAGKEIITELRLKNKNKQESCFRTEYRIVFNDKIPIYAIGKLSNIDREKYLLIKAETDSLTGLYNKETTQRKIEQALNESSSNIKNALFIIDIDDFKYVNDTFGHQFGDMLLVEIASTMKRFFRDNDFVGRLGGDEFMIFMHNFPNESILQQKATMLIAALHLIKVGDNKKDLTASIGISFFPTNGYTYEELYRTADIALYNAKNLNKDTFLLYQKGMDMDALQKKTEIDYNTLEQGFDHNIVFKVFEMLQRSDDLSITINEIISMVGKFFSVDHSYIFAKKLLLDGSTIYDNAYQWCVEGMGPNIGILQEIPNHIYTSAWQQYDNKGIFLCNDITELKGSAFDLLQSQNIKSVLQCIVRQNNEIKLMLGFNTSLEKRRWTIEEASTLLYITQILGGYL